MRQLRARAACQSHVYLELWVEALGLFPFLQLLGPRLHLSGVCRRGRAQHMVQDAFGERVGLPRHLDRTELDVHFGCVQRSSVAEEQWWWGSYGRDVDANGHAKAILSLGLAAGFTVKQHAAHPSQRGGRRKVRRGRCCDIASVAGPKKAPRVTTPSSDLRRPTSSRTQYELAVELSSPLNYSE